MSDSGNPGSVRTRKGEVDWASVAQKPAWSARVWSTSRPFPNDLRRARAGPEGVGPAQHSIARHK